MDIPDSKEPDKNNFWRSLFDADSIAVIGANNIVDSWGYNSMKAAISALHRGTNKQVYAINPNIPEILGLASCNSILDVPGPVELAIIVVPAPIVPDIMRQCVRKQVKAAVIISAGFAEVDDAGARAQEELLEIARQGGIRFVGPNCPGHAHLHSQVGSSGIGERIQPGPVALLSQSGTVSGSISHNAATRGIGLSKYVGTGNEASLHLEDYLEYLADDEDTRIIMAYIEGLREGRRFFQLAQEITTRKPLIVLKAGATKESSKAARSHTGALSGSDAVYTAAFKQAGVIRVEDEEELCDVALALLSQPLPRGTSVGILTMGGGFGVLTAEACEKEGLKIDALESQTIEKLNKILPSRWSHSNPVDLVGIKPGAEDNTVISCLSLIMEDKNIDSLISFLPPIGNASVFAREYSPEQMSALQKEGQKRTNFLIQQVKQYNKPLLLMKRFNIQPTQGSKEAYSNSQTRIPEYTTPRRAARVLRHLSWYREYLNYHGKI